MTPTIATTVGQLTITNTKDVNNFVYPSFSSLANLSFNTVLPLPILYIDSSNTSSYTMGSADNISTFLNIGSTSGISYVKSDYARGAGGSTPIPSIFKLISSSANFNGKNSFRIQGCIGSVENIPFSSCSVSMVIYGYDGKGLGLNTVYTVLFASGGPYYNTSTIKYSDHSMAIPAGTITSYVHQAFSVVHYVFVRNGTISKIYANGVLVATTNNGSINSTSTSPFVFLGEASNGQWAFNGEVGNVKLWSSALTDDQCISIYQQEKTKWGIV